MAQERGGGGRRLAGVVKAPLKPSGRLSSTGTPKSTTPKQSFTVPEDYKTTSLNRGGYTVGPASVSSQPSDGGGPYGGGSGGGGAAAPAPGIATDADFLNSDPNVIAQRAAYNKAFEQLLAELDLGKGQYEADYGTSLKNLGWQQDAKGGQGDWDLANTATSSGRGFTGLQNDYASRGMLQGSGYAEALESFLKGLGQQKEQLGTARGNFLADNNLKRTQGQQTRDEQIRLAEAAALANRAGLLTSIQGLV